MATTITIRDVPDDVRDELASRAALAGRTLEAHLLVELTELARRPSMDALMAKIRARKAATGTRIPADRILELLDRDRE
jgi:plasmid stability protein